MQHQDLRFYVYRASDIIKRPIGAYCAQLYREAIGDNEYLIALKKNYKVLNSGKLNSNTLDGMLEEADTRAWFKLVRQHLHDRLTYFVPKRSRDLAKQHIAVLIRAYNAAYHQQPFDRASAQEALQTTLAFMRLINHERAEEPIKAQLQHACEALEALVAELYIGQEHEGQGGQLTAWSPANALPTTLPPAAIVPPPTTLPSPRRSIMPMPGNSMPGNSMMLPDNPDDQHTAQVQPHSLYTLQAVASDGRIAEFALHQNEITIGRGPQADFQIADPQISRLHLRINLRGQLTLTDLGSTGGTKLENEEVPSHIPIPWQVGKPVLIGNTRLMLKWTM